MSTQSSIFTGVERLCIISVAFSILGSSLGSSALSVAKFAVGVASKSKYKKGPKKALPVVSQSPLIIFLLPPPPSADCGLNFQPHRHRIPVYMYISASFFFPPPLRLSVLLAPKGTFLSSNFLGVRVYGLRRNRDTKAQHRTGQYLWRVPS
ncbi:uncharacterized protein BDR25DRAFT_99184 [Lindgomyces ingoldianus]|uniref:Uncharacterized protein n=1 Tax=Lindgomyces ingoldianus TaxID=673940 RepID=A0ACB6QAK4_9PLEO|nr:uncharacterized protein BDR25DRAFT_99184 [Lindgomyces ingoldianus]KAF2464054.1 hypothetical protein BDR25DRAFT_99184 [Lindgomyces ingoldianus]